MTCTTDGRGRVYVQMKDRLLHVPTPAQIFFDPTSKYLIEKKNTEGHKHLSIFRYEDFRRERASQYRAVTRTVEGLEIRISGGKVRSIEIPQSSYGHLGNPETVVLDGIRDKILEVWAPEELDTYEKEHIRELPKLMEVLLELGDQPTL